eukprot:scaffold5341_cov96-Skeletonema_menzelii.AAC.1
MEIFSSTGAGGRAPLHVTHIRIDKSVDEIEDVAFNSCEKLLQVETHDGIRKVGSMAFWGCRSLRLETIGNEAFIGCTSLTHLKLPSIINIKLHAFFDGCKALIDIELSERLESIEEVHSVT